MTMKIRLSTYNLFVILASLFYIALFVTAGISFLLFSGQNAIGFAVISFLLTLPGVFVFFRAMSAKPFAQIYIDENSVSCGKESIKREDVKLTATTIVEYGRVYHALIVGDVYVTTKDQLGLNLPRTFIIEINYKGPTFGSKKGKAIRCLLDYYGKPVHILNDFYGGTRFADMIEAHNEKVKTAENV